MNHDKHHARYAYEALILRQSHINFKGLWTDDAHYYIVCPTLNQSPLTAANEPLIEWFDYTCRSVTCPVTLVSQAPEKSYRVNERTVKELSQLHGEPLNIVDLNREAISALQKDFPLHSLTTEHGKVVVHTSRLLSEDEKSELHIILGNIKIELAIEIRLVPDESDEGGSFSNVPPKSLDTMAPITSKAIRSSHSIPLRSAYEEDEEFWIDSRRDLFSTESLSRNKILNSSFTEKTSSCFIDATVLPPKNIRTYLPIYRRLIIAMPLASYLANALQALSVTKVEIFELVRRGRVQFVLPQSIERYSQHFISEILEINPASVLFSRRLAATSVTETRLRLPFLYPPFGSRERRFILELFSNVSDPMFEPIAEIIREQLGSGWVGMELNLSRRGAMGTANHSIAPILGELLNHFTGKDLRLEIITGSMSVEWAAALHSIYCPFENEGYSDSNVAYLCASIYSGVKNSSIVNPLTNLDFFVKDLLTLNNDASVIEIDEVFTSKDIDRLGEIVKEASHKEDINQALNSLNDKVRKFETNQNRLIRLDILGLGGVAVATALTQNVYVPFGVWVAQYVLKNADPSRDFGGKVIDWIRAVNTRTSTDAVLVSRLRRKARVL